MQIDDLPLPSVEHLMQVFLPIERVSSELAQARRLATSTADGLHAADLPPNLQERFYSSIVTRQILPHYGRLLEHYEKYRSDIAAWVPHDSVALQHALGSSRSDLSRALLTEDSSIVSAFIGDAQRVSERLAVRFKALTY
jgi:hypothetical protein